MPASLPASRGVTTAVRDGKPLYLGMCSMPPDATGVLHVWGEVTDPAFEIDEAIIAFDVTPSSTRGQIACVAKPRRRRRARSVHGVWPTVTYPAHATLVTGVTPARHGIVNNVLFDSGARRTSRTKSSWCSWGRHVSSPRSPTPRQQHAHGPMSKEAWTTLERIDGMVAELIPVGVSSVTASRIMGRIVNCARRGFAFGDR